MEYPLNETNYNWKRRKKCGKGGDGSEEKTSTPTLTFTNDDIQWLGSGGVKEATVYLGNPDPTDNEYAWILSQEEPLSGIMAGEYSTIKVSLPDETPSDYYLSREVSDSPYEIKYSFDRRRVERSGSAGIQNILIHRLPGGSAGNEWVMYIIKYE